MRIYFASDHAGFELKGKLSSYLHDQDYEIIDFGPFELESTDDYPDYIAKVARAVGKDEFSVGIVLGGSGQGEAMMANNFLNVRAVAYYGGNQDILKLSREHNNANVLSLGARFINEEEAKAAVDLWLGTKFSGEARHVRRLAKLEEEARQGYKSLWLEQIGWFGVILILGAYLANISGVLAAQDTGYLLANIVGALFVMLDARQDKNTQAVVINLVWVVAGVIGMMMLII